MMTTVRDGPLTLDTRLARANHAHDAPALLPMQRLVGIGAITHFFPNFNRQSSPSKGDMNGIR
jgi:hypothetical protein